MVPSEELQRLAEAERAAIFPRNNLLKKVTGMAEAITAGKNVKVVDEYGQTKIGGVAGKALPFVLAASFVAAKAFEAYNNQRQLD
jgi:hypothetical protein